MSGRLLIVEDTRAEPRPARADLRGHLRDRAGSRRARRRSRWPSTTHSGPDPDGHRATRAERAGRGPRDPGEQRCDVPIVAVSSHVMPGDRERALDGRLRRLRAPSRSTTWCSSRSVAACSARDERAIERRRRAAGAHPRSSTTSRSTSTTSSRSSRRTASSPRPPRTGSRRSSGSRPSPPDLVLLDVMMPEHGRHQRAPDPQGATPRRG